MAGAAIELSGRLALVADHLVLALAEGRDTGRPTFLLSWYAVAYAAGAPGGNLAFVHAAGSGADRELILTDQPDLDQALRARLSPRTWPLDDPGQPSRPATFARTPVHGGRVSASIRAGDVEIDVAWEGLARPIVATGRVGADPPWDSSTVLLEAGSWTASWNGHPIQGRPFPNDVWRTWFGHPLTSALVALAEVFREAAA